MASQKAKNANAYNNNGGVVIQAGDVSSKLTDLSIRGNLASTPAYGTSVVQDTPVSPADYTDPHGVVLAKAGGTFAYTPLPGTNFLMMGAGDNASSINGVSSPALSGILGIPGGSAGQVINKNIKTTQLGTYSSTKFNLLATPSSGNFPGLTRGNNAGVAVTYVATTGNVAGTDDAASTTRAVPGELTYRFGSWVPARNIAYKAKDSAESGILLS